jgi:threonine dehydratase
MTTTKQDKIKDGKGSTAAAADVPSLETVARLARGAVARLRDRALPSPLVESEFLSQRFGCRVLLKCEQFLPTGSFKFRGAYNKLSNMSDSEKALGIVTASTGNHGLALATVASEAGIPITVHATQNASTRKIEAIRSLGAKVELHDADPLTVELLARRLASESGAVYVSPYNDVDVIAGQGGCAAEILDDGRKVDVVVVSVGGGGLLSGIGAVLRKEAPDVEVIAAWPENAQSLLHSMRAGRAVDFDETPTLADGTAGGVEPGAVTINLAHTLDPTPVLVSELEIARSMRDLAMGDGLIVEGSAALALAALEKCAPRLAGKTAVVVLCGKNIALEKFAAILADEDGGGS